MVDREKLVPAGGAPPSSAYSHGLSVDVGDTRIVFVTGQIAIDDAGDVISTDVEVQTRFVFARIGAILHAGGLSMNDVVKAQIFLTDLRDLAIVSSVRDEYFDDPRPATTLVEVGALVRPTCHVEIEVTAIAKRPSRG
ncbi:MAG TPA: RidA family protein [Solirubrobacterales bacterium]|nr:RidA family protein [Solirubrobacterales bacterium]